MNDLVFAVLMASVTLFISLLGFGLGYALALRHIDVALHGHLKKLIEKYNGLS